MMLTATYRTSQPGGAVRQCGLRAANCQRPLPCHATFTNYIQQLLTYVVDMPNINNSWGLREFKDELKKEINSACACQE